MNKTVNINLAGIFFHIDEDAYLKLSRYLEAIKRSFTDSQGRSEIITDIEARIAELFSERIQNEKHVVSIKLVDEVIAIMGQPEDYIVDEEIFEDEPKAKTKSTTQDYAKPNKKLYRDTDKSYIGGVAAGLSHYLKINVIWVRLLWLFLAIFSGFTFVVVYIIFWALVPEAKTTAEKLIMSGDPVTISNIEKKIKDGIDTVSDKIKNVDFQKQGEKLKEGLDQVTDSISETVKNVKFKKQGSKIQSNSQNFFDAIGAIVMLVIKLFAKFIGLILILTGVSTLISLLVAVVVGSFSILPYPASQFIEASNPAEIPVALVLLFVLFAIGIPFFFLFYLGLKIVIKNLKSIGNVAKFTLLGLWIIGVVGLIITGIKQASEHAFDAKIVKKEQLNITANDTIVLQMKPNDNYYSYTFSRNNYDTFFEDTDGAKLISDRIKLIVRSTKENNAYMIIEKEATGSHYNLAKKRANNIDYSFSLKNGILYLNDYLTTPIENKISDQKVTVIVYLPEGSILFADNNTYDYHRSPSYYNDILENGMEQHYLKILDGKVKCLDCNTLNNDTSEVKKSNKKRITQEEKSKINVTISDEEGVKIERTNN